MGKKRQRKCHADAVMNHIDLLKISLPPVSYDTQAPNLAAELTADGNTLDAAYALAQILLQGITPNIGSLLEDWERVYATPSLCLQSIGLTRTQRVSAVINKINEGGTFTKAKAIEIAANFGYTITINEQRFREYATGYGLPYAGCEWNFVWYVSTINNTISPRNYGDEYGAGYREWGNLVLECVINAKVQADTLVQFIYL